MFTLAWGIELGDLSPKPPKRDEPVTQHIFDGSRLCNTCVASLLRKLEGSDLFLDLAVIAHTRKKNAVCSIQGKCAKGNSEAAGRTCAACDSGPAGSKLDTPCRNCENTNAHRVLSTSAPSAKARGGSFQKLPLGLAHCQERSP